MEYLRDEDVDVLPQDATAFDREKNKIRKILLGNCKLMDPKMEKNAAYEITPAVSKNAINFNHATYRKMTNSLSAITLREMSIVVRNLSLSLHLITPSKIPYSRVSLHLEASDNGWRVYGNSNL